MDSSILVLSLLIIILINNLITALLLVDCVNKLKKLEELGNRLAMRLARLAGEQ